MASKRVLVSGANKGIGLSIAKGLLEAGCFVFIGSRDVGRGEEAAKSLGFDNSQWQVVQLDVTDPTSVDSATKTIKATCGDESLYALVNNAGGAAGGMSYTNHDDWLYCIELNFHGVVRLTEAILPLMGTRSRVVTVGSGAAPTYVSKCSDERQAQFINPKISKDDINAMIEAFRAVSSAENSKAEDFEAVGLGNGASYGFSKALVATYGMYLAAAHPDKSINSCSPGFIETDLSRPILEQMGKTAADMGMKQPDDGAKAPLFLTLGDVLTPAGESWFYGSDCQRSPLHKYRSPGDPPYDGVTAQESAASMDNLSNIKMSDK